jgi:hypothetical protein
MANLSLIFVLLFSLGLVHSHSWLDCVKDVGSGLNTGDADCRGYARGYPGRLPGVNVDEIMTYRIQPRIMGQNPPICKSNQQNSNQYSSRFYMTQARAGETLRMRWTPNGHQRGAGQNPLTYTIHWTGVPGTQLTNRLQLNDTNKLAGPFPFDATCYCNNCAGNPCYGSFTIPANTRTGVYSFIWYWIFNRDASSGGEEYTTCFDVAVTGTNNAPVVQTSAPVARTSAVTSAPRTSARTSAARTSNPVIITEDTTSEKETVNVSPTLVIQGNNSDVDNITGTGNLPNVAMGLVLFVLLTISLF